MEYSDWSDNIIGTIKKIADKNYQEQSWFGKGRVISSPEELICELFDDYLVEEFVEQYNAKMSERQFKYLKLLLNLLNDYVESMDSNSDPYIVFNDKRWEYIREVSQIYLKSL